MKIPPYKKPDPERINLTPVPMTPEGIKELERKLERLRSRLPALAEEVARTAAFGDRSDNAEYKAAKGALRFTTYEVSRIEDELKRVVPIERGNTAKGVVGLGSRVTVEIVAANTKPEQKTFEILGPAETNPTKGRISNESPLGKALVGHKVGEVVTIKTTDGEKKYRIVDVD